MSSMATCLATTSVTKLALPMHLVLQCSKERVGRDVIVTVAGAAAQRAHIVGAGSMYQRPAGTLSVPAGTNRESA